MAEQHYLEKELYELIQSDSHIFDFLQLSALDGLWYWDVEEAGNEWMSRGFWELFGFDPNEKIHHVSEWQDLIFPEDLEVAIDNFQKHCEDPDHPYDQVVRYKHKDGSTVWVRCRGIGIRDESGKVVRMLGAHNDLTQLKKIEQELLEKNNELERLVRHDQQTGLLNRRGFNEAFEKQLELASREGVPVSVAMVDVDHFKAINDKLGHLAGDEVLLKIASVLKSVARNCDYLARFGGEEFTIMMFGADQQQAMEAAERFRMSVDQQVMAERINVTISIGISTLSKEQLAKETPLRVSARERIYDSMILAADKAMYRAKEQGRNRVISEL